MGIRADLRTYLLADATISGLVGTRIFGMRIPSRDTNADLILFYQTGSGDGHDLGLGTGGWDARSFRFVAMSKTFTTAESIADAVRDKLKGYMGAIGSTTAYSVMLDNEEDAYFEAEDGSDAGIYTIHQDYTVIVQES